MRFLSADHPAYVFAQLASKWMGEVNALRDRASNRRLGPEQRGQLIGAANALLGAAMELQDLALAFGTEG